MYACMCASEYYRKVNSGLKLTHILTQTHIHTHTHTPGHSMSKKCDPIVKTTCLLFGMFACRAVAW